MSGNSVKNDSAYTDLKLKRIGKKINTVFDVMVSATASPNLIADRAFDMSKRIGICPCCERKTRLTFHHLIPKKMHRRTYFKKHVPREIREQGILVCRQCHSGIHRFYDEMTLAKQFNSLTLIKDDAQLNAFFMWVAKQRVKVD
jgi:hypothetical protein